MSLGMLLNVDSLSKSSSMTEILLLIDFGGLNRSGSLTQQTTSCPDSTKTGSNLFPI